jgi:hypothetical protein
MIWLQSRLSEPSTKNGLAVALQLAKAVPVLAPYALVLDTLSALLAGNAIVTPDKA